MKNTVEIVHDERGVFDCICQCSNTFQASFWSKENTATRQVLEEGTAKLYAKCPACSGFSIMPVIPSPIDRAAKKAQDMERYTRGDYFPS